MKGRRYRISRLLLAAIATLVIGTATTAAAFYLGWKLVLSGRADARPADILELVKVALLIAGSAGALVLLVVHFRRQMVNEDEHRLLLASDSREERRVLSERFDSAVKLLGNVDSAAVRLAGVYALASVADDWPSERQTCIDVLCSYMRLNSSSDVSSGGETEVRLSISNSIVDHLRATPGRDWSGHKFNFAGVVFARDAFDNLRATGCFFDLRGARLEGDGLSFSGSHFINCQLNLSTLQLDGGSFTAAGCHFQDCRITMTDATLNAGTVSFARSTFEWSQASSGHKGIEFDRLRLKGGTLRLAECRFDVGQRGYRSPAVITLRNLELSGGLMDMRRAHFGVSGSIDMHLCALELNDSSLNGGVIDLSDCHLEACWISFIGVVLDSGDVILRQSRIHRATVSFSGAKLRGGCLDFRELQLLGAATSRSYEHPPSFPRWLAPVRRLGEEERRRLHHSELKRPKFPTIDFIDASLLGTKIDFTRMIGQAGVVDFAGTKFGDSEVTFADTHFEGTVLMLELAVWTEGSGSIAFSLPDPVLVLGTSTDPARERIALVGSIPVRSEWKPNGHGQHRSWPNAIVISGSD